MKQFKIVKEVDIIENENNRKCPVCHCILDSKCMIYHLGRKLKDM